MSHRHRSCLLILLIIFSTFKFLLSEEDDPGFSLYIGTTNTDEMQERSITFDKPLPKWFTGTLIRIGPGQYEMGQRKFGHLFDVFGKLHSWTFNGNGFGTYTTKIIKSDFYIRSNNTGDITKALLYGRADPPLNFNLSSFEKLEFLDKGIDNPNRNVYNLSGNCIAMGTSFQANVLDCYNLESVTVQEPQIKKTDLKFPFWVKHTSPNILREFGVKDYHIAIVTKISVLPIIPHQILIARVHNVAIYEKITDIEVNNAPYLPTFSVTENYVIVYVPPFYLNVAKYEESLVLKDNLEFKNGEPSFLYVIEVKTGTVVTLKTNLGFVMHHINAYEVNKTKINVDVCLYDDAKILDYYDLSVLMNKTKRDSLKWRPKITRMQLDLVENSVNSITFNNSDKVAYSAELGFPTINEVYRSKPYCFVYGIVFAKNNTIFSQWKIVKKNLCNDTGDLQFDVPSVYPTEVTFVADPTGSKEDDGYLLMPAFNTVTNSSDLIIIDARTMLINNTATLPTFVPFTLHGGMFSFPKP